MLDDIPVLFISTLSGGGGVILTYSLIKRFSPKKMITILSSFLIITATLYIYFSGKLNEIKLLDNILFPVLINSIILFIIYLMYSYSLKMTKK